MMIEQKFWCIIPSSPPPYIQKHTFSCDNSHTCLEWKYTNFSTNFQMHVLSSTFHKLDTMHFIYLLKLAVGILIPANRSKIFK